MLCRARFSRVFSILVIFYVQKFCGAKHHHPLYPIPLIFIQVFFSSPNTKMKTYLQYEERVESISDGGAGGMMMEKKIK